MIKEQINTALINLTKCLTSNLEIRSVFVIFPSVIWVGDPSSPSNVTWGAVPANGADVLWHSPGARTLVVDVSKVLQAWRRLDVLWAANTVHRIHLRTTGRREERTETKSWSWGGQNWTKQSRGGSRGEVRMESVRPSHDTLPLPLFSHFVFRSQIRFFFLPSHTLYCESVSGRDHMLG